MKITIVGSCPEPMIRKILETHPGAIVIAEEPKPPPPKELLLKFDLTTIEPLPVIKEKQKSPWNQRKKKR